jgi:hypothetical protein
MEKTRERSKVRTLGDITDIHKVETVDFFNNKA